MVRNIYRLIKRKKMIEMREQIKPGKTPATITVSMIDQDLKDGVSKSDMAVKYGIKPWEVDEMFKHPFLKGRRPSRKKALSFSFVDDLEPADNGTLVPAEVEEEFVDPNQVTLHDAIDSAIESAEEAKVALDEAVEAVEEIFPTQQEEEEDYNTAENYEDKDTDEYTADCDEEELKMDDDSFEL